MCDLSSELPLKVMLLWKANPIEISNSCLICAEMVDLAVFATFNGQPDVPLKREKQWKGDLFVLSAPSEVCIFQPELGHTHTSKQYHAQCNVTLCNLSDRSQHVWTLVWMWGRVLGILAMVWRKWYGNDLAPNYINNGNTEWFPL